MEINNSTLERLKKKETQLKLELTEIKDEIAQRQKEETTKSELKEKERERFLKDRYNRLCDTIISSEFPTYYITDKKAHIKIHEDFFINLNQEIIDKIKQKNFSFIEYKNLIQNQKDLKIVQEKN